MTLNFIKALRERRAANRAADRAWIDQLPKERCYVGYYCRRCHTRFEPVSYRCTAAPGIAKDLAERGVHPVWEPELWITTSHACADGSFGIADYVDVRVEPRAKTPTALEAEIARH